MKKETVKRKVYYLKPKKINRIKHLAGIYKTSESRLISALIPDSDKIDKNILKRLATDLLV